MLEVIGARLKWYSVIYNWLNVWLGAAAYQLGNTSSRTITEVEQR